MGRNVTKIDKDAMLEYVRTSGGQVIANKGATSMQYLLQYANW